MSQPFKSSNLLIGIATNIRQYLSYSAEYWRFFIVSEIIDRINRLAFKTGYMKMENRFTLFYSECRWKEHIMSMHCLHVCLNLYCVL